MHVHLKIRTFIWTFIICGMHYKTAVQINQETLPHVVLFWMEKGWWTNTWKRKLRKETKERFPLIYLCFPNASEHLGRQAGRHPEQKPDTTSLFTCRKFFHVLSKNLCQSDTQSCYNIWSCQLRRKEEFCLEYQTFHVI